MDRAVNNAVRRNTVIIVLMAGMMLLGLSAWSADPAYAAGKNPGKVTSLTLTVTGQPMAKLQWKKATGDATGYMIYRDGKAYVKVTGKDSVAYTDESIKPGKSYTYKVRPYYKSKKGKMTYGKMSPAKKVVKGYTYRKASGGSAILTGYSGKAGYKGKFYELKTPSKIVGLKVKEIGDSCFRGNVWITKVTVAKGVTVIDDYAFEACSSLKSASLPSSARTIGDGAFSGCAQMRYCELPDGITSIGKGAFLYCSKLTYAELPKQLKTMGDFAFAGCEKLGDVTFNGDQLTKIPDRAFCQCKRLDEVTIPASVESIGKRAFSDCTALTICKFETSEVSIGDYAFERSGIKDTADSFFDLMSSGTAAHVFVGFGAYSAISGGFAGEGEIQLVFPDDTTFDEGAFYGSEIKGIASMHDGHPQAEKSAETFDNYVLEDGVLYSSDKKTLIAWFPEKAKRSAYGLTYEQTRSAKTGRFTVPAGVETIAPYAFYGSGLKEVNLSSVKRVEHNAFTMSNVEPGMVHGRAVIDPKAFEDNKIKKPVEPDYGNLGDDEEEPGEGGEPGSGGVKTQTFVFESEAGDSSIFDPEKFASYLDIHEGFQEWVNQYVAYNKDYVPMTAEANPYIFMYTGNAHYNQMTSALNGDVTKTKTSILLSGDDYKDMYLMIDHGLFAELGRGRMPGNLLLYSGITCDRVAALAGDPPGAQVPITEEQKRKIIDRIGDVYEDQAIMSTTANIYTAFAFSTGTGKGNTIIMIYGSKKALDSLGTICVDGFSQFSGEEEILFNPYAKYKILDLGTVTETEVTLDPATGRTIGSKEGAQRTYVKLQLLDGSKGAPKKVHR